MSPFYNKATEDCKGRWGTAPYRPASPVLNQLKSKERAQSQRQRYQWFNRWGRRDLPFLKQNPGATPHCVRQVVNWTWKLFLPTGEEEE